MKYRLYLSGDLEFGPNDEKLRQLFLRASAFDEDMKTAVSEAVRELVEKATDLRITFTREDKS